MTRQQRIIALDLRLVMARQWFALIADVGDYRDAFITAYPMPRRIPRRRRMWTSARIPRPGTLFRHWPAAPWMVARCYEYLLADSSPITPTTAVAGIAGADHKLSTTARSGSWRGRADFLRSRSRLQDDAWVPDHLDYQFAVSAPRPTAPRRSTSRRLRVGRLDWYSLDLDKGITTLGDVAGSEATGLPPDAPFTTIPIPVSFSGMPNTRWWAFEDHATNFGDIDASTTDLAKLLFMEFALVYSNDWFVVPCTLPFRCVAQVRGLAVTNVFGERLWIGAGRPRRRQRLGPLEHVHDQYSQCSGGQRSRPTRLCCCCRLCRQCSSGPAGRSFPGARRSGEHGMGRRKNGPSGQRRQPSGQRGRKTNLQLPAALRRAARTPPPLAAAVRYQAMNSVPENWIPLHSGACARQQSRDPITARGHAAHSRRRQRLRQKVQPRHFAAAPGTGPRSRPQTYFLHEEEVPRAGTRVTQYYSRSRWTQGQVYTWLRVRKQTGRGEASSGLGFDRLVDKDHREI